MGRQTRKWSYKHDKLTQCCRAFTLALARLSCFSSVIYGFQISCLVLHFVGSLNESLRYFEILHPSDFHRMQERRDRRNAFSQEFVMSFSALGRFVVRLLWMRSITVCPIKMEDTKLMAVGLTVRLVSKFAVK